MSRARREEGWKCAVLVHVQSTRFCCGGGKASVCRPHPARAVDAGGCPVPSARTHTCIKLSGHWVWFESRSFWPPPLECTFIGCVCPTVRLCCEHGVCAQVLVLLRQ